MDLKFRKWTTGMAALIFVVLLIPAAKSIAGVYGSLSMDNYYDNNIYRISTPINAFINSNSLSLKYIPDSSNFALSYKGAMNLVTDLPELNNYYYTAGVAYNNKFGRDIPSEINFYVNGSARFNINEYELYNNNLLSGGISLKHILAGSVYNTYGYELNYKSYTDNPVLTYSENNFYSGLKVFFETKTSVDFNLIYSVKSYNSGGQSGMGGRKSQDNSVGQMIAALNIGQSLFDNTGLSINYRQKFNVSGSAFLQSALETDFFYESEIYDDPYSYESKELTVKLTQLLPANMKLTALGFYYMKDYSYYADNMIDKRQDSKTGVVLSVRKSYYGNWLFFKNLSLALNYYYVDNQTNLALFRHNSNAFSFSIATNIF